MLNTKQDSRYPEARLGNVRLEKACMVTGRLEIFSFWNVGYGYMKNWYYFYLLFNVYFYTLAKYDIFNYDA